MALPGYPRDMIYGINLLKALKRGLAKYLELPAHVEDAASAVFKKPIVRAHVFGLGMMHFYQSDNRSWTRQEFTGYLCKIANPRLVDETQTFYQKVVTRIKQWYREESKGLTAEVSSRNLSKFFDALAVELGVDDVQGPLPFGPRAHKWD